jgi:curved DNA-binding protein CbpA
MSDPFDILGLRADADLTDDDVRSAWRRVASATHPDRADGGDPVAFAAAAAAYTALRTAASRREVVADRREQASGRIDRDPVPAREKPLAALAADAARQIRRGRPVRLAARLVVTVAVGALAVAAVGWQPASVAIITGALTWLLLTGRRDLAAGRVRR